MYKRIYDDLTKISRKNRVLIVYGPRRTGKTTLLNAFLQKSGTKYLLENGENIRFSEMLSALDMYQIKEFMGEYDIAAIDEAHMIPDIGRVLKLMVDHVPDTKFIATGSSSFDLSQRIGEPLTGRKKTVILYPLSQMELRSHYTRYELYQKLEDFLIFGSYPEVLNLKNRMEKIEILQELTDSYLLKDILVLDTVRASSTIFSLVKLLAFQVGNLLSLHELASQLHISVKTVGRYLDLLEKSFVIKKIGGFSRNLRKEITSKAKYYFIDNGVRNAVISRCGGLNDRDDQGALFENFLVSERIKRNAYQGFYGNMYFWRSYDGQEIDWIEEIDGKLKAYEFKWGKKMPKTPSLWRRTYPDAPYSVISRENYLDFVIPEQPYDEDRKAELENT